MWTYVGIEKCEEMHHFLMLFPYVAGIRRGYTNFYFFKSKSILEWLETIKVINQGYF